MKTNKTKCSNNKFSRLTIIKLHVNNKNKFIKGTTVDTQIMYRKNTLLARQNTQDTTLITLETNNKKDMGIRSSLILRNEKDQDDRGSFGS